LGTYGFGTLLKQWELQLVKKSPEEYTKAREKAAKGESYLVTFVLPQLPQFQGLSQRIQKVRGSTPTGDLIKLLCDRYKVATPEQFAIASMDGFIFSRTEGLEYYGLGRKFDNMAVKLVAIVQEKEKQRGCVAKLSSFTSFAFSNELRVLPLCSRAASVHFNSDYIWTQVDDQLDIKEARAVILDLDKQLGFALDKTSQLRSDMDKLASMLKRTEKAKEAVEAERDHIIGQAKKLIEIYTDVTNQKGQLLEEKGQRMQEIDGLRRQVELQQTSAVQAQFKHESQVMEFEQKLFSVSKELDGEKTRVSALQADLSATQTELSTLQTEKSRLREALQRAITELKTRREVEQQQTTELNALNDGMSCVAAH
jgi:septal ring factor EnvC (AmiA/AmiB activator)